MGLRRRRPRSEAVPGGLEPNSWRLLCELALQQRGLALIACTAELEPLVMNRPARAIVGEQRPGQVPPSLPEPLVHGARTYVARDAEAAGTIAPVRIELATGPVYLSVMRVSELGPIALALLLHREVVRESQLMDALRQRYALSVREWQVINLVRLGHPNKEIAYRLDLAEGTVRVYLHEAYRKLGIRTRAQLASLIEQLRRGGDKDRSA